MKGRKPKPAALKLLEGERRDRMHAFPMPPKGRPERPAHLDKVGAAEWDRMVPLLEAMGVLAEIDGAALAIYCTAFARWRKALADVAEFGLIIHTDLGGTKANPAVTIARDSEAAMARLLAEFGCTPSSRSRVRVKESPKDELSVFLSKRRES